MKLELKFYGYGTTGFEVIQVFVKLKIAAPPSSAAIFRYCQIFCLFSHSVTSPMLEGNLVHVA